MSRLGAQATLPLDFKIIASMIISSWVQENKACLKQAYGVRCAVASVCGFSSVKGIDLH